MAIIGIAQSHDGSIAVLKDGKNIFSIGDERLNRIKAYIGFPFAGLKYVIEEGIVSPDEVESVVIGTHTYFPPAGKDIFAFVMNEDKVYYDFQNKPKPDNYYVNDEEWKSIETEDQCKEYVLNKIQALLDQYNIKASIIFKEHHLCHAAAAYYSSGMEDCLAITMDAYGDDLSASVSVCKNGKIERIHQEPYQHSLGNFYTEVTAHCGYRRSRHEGKITGLAAYGDAKKYKDKLDKCFQVNEGKISINYLSDNLLDKFVRLSKNFITPEMNSVSSQIIKDLGTISHEDLAACAQYVVEERTKEFISYWLNKTGLKNVVCAGGVFANVKVNQRIAELDGVEKLFIHQNMGDGGNAFGAAALEYFSHNEYVPSENRYTNVYFGPSYSNDQVEKVLQDHSDAINFHKSADTTKDTAKLLAEDKIVGWFQGGMEYGPRALGNRSIIASPKDKTINKWLNDRLSRTEFMPFAPSCLYEHADELFDISSEEFKFPALFMTITFDMKDEWVKKAPAVAHIDNTARPQLVSAETNKRYHEVLQHYYELTGLPLFINTSFNVHEEPIVCSPEDAVKPLISGVIDYLVIEDFICTKK